MKTIHKLLALALCLALLCGAVSATMRETGTSGLKLADEVTYTHTSWSNDQKEGQYLQEHTLTYTACGAVRPMVVYGDTLYGRSPMNYAAKFLEDKNLVLVAGVNGSFFDMNNGIPYGLIVTEGILRSSGNISSIGFFADGKTVIGPVKEIQEVKNAYRAYDELGKFDPFSIDELPACEHSSTHRIKVIPEAS